MLRERDVEREREFTNGFVVIREFLCWFDLALGIEFPDLHQLVCGAPFLSALRSDEKRNEWVKERKNKQTLGGGGDQMIRTTQVGSPRDVCDDIGMSSALLHQRPLSISLALINQERSLCVSNHDHWRPKHSRIPRETIAVLRLKLFLSFHVFGRSER